MDEYWWEAEGWPSDLGPYVILIRTFIEGRIAAPEFETLYLVLFKRDPTHRSADVFGVLDRLFADVDSYVLDPTVRAEVNGLDVDQLRLGASDALERLRSLIQGTNG